MSEPMTDEGRDVDAALNVLADVTGTEILKKNVGGHLVAVVLPSLRDFPEISLEEQAKLWGACADAVQGLVDEMRKVQVCG